MLIRMLVIAMLIINGFAQDLNPVQKTSAELLLEALGIYLAVSRFRNETFQFQEKTTMRLTLTSANSSITALIKSTLQSNMTRS